MTKEELKLADDINDLAGKIHKNAINKGFHDPNEPIEQWRANQINNLHGEVSELWEAWRNNQWDRDCGKEGLDMTCEEEEYADIVIRVLDQCERQGINIGKAIIRKHHYNLTRPYKHGRKRN